MSLEIPDKLYNIYRNFNIKTQIDEMRDLDLRDLYLLLTLCLDKFKDVDTNPTIINNLIPFESEIMELKSLFETEKTTNEFILELVKITENSYINTEMLTYNGIKLPEPYTIQEIRDLRINELINE